MHVRWRVSVAARDRRLPVQPAEPVTLTQWAHIHPVECWCPGRGVSHPNHCPWQHRSVLSCTCGNLWNQMSPCLLVSMLDWFHRGCLWHSITFLLPRWEDAHTAHNVADDLWGSDSSDYDDYCGTIWSILLPASSGCKSPFCHNNECSTFVLEMLVMNDQLYYTLSCLIRW
jgi:hypothetical protein